MVLKAGMDDMGKIKTLAQAGERMPTICPATRRYSIPKMKIHN
jgi:hypothetical protein